MNEDKAILITAALIVVLVFCYIVYMATNHSFLSKCEGAGYKAAQLEACVKRASAGGPVYEENIKEWK